MWNKNEIKESFFYAKIKVLLENINTNKRKRIYSFHPTIIDIFSRGILVYIGVWLLPINYSFLWVASMFWPRAIVFFRYCRLWILVQRALSVFSHVIGGSIDKRVWVFYKLFDLSQIRCHLYYFSFSRIICPFYYIKKFIIIFH